MNDEFVRKDVFEAEVRRLDEHFDSAVSRMEAKIDAGISEMKAQNAAFREHVSNELADMKGKILAMDGKISAMDGKISALQAKVDNISGNVVLIMTIAGIVISGLTLFIQIYMR